MADTADDWGERAATEQEVTDWVALVRSARTASRTFRNRPDEVDHMRPPYGSGRASSEGEG